MTMYDRNAAPLDEFVLKAVMMDARRFVMGGLTIDEAARRAGNGAWRPYRDEVARRLHAEYNPVRSASAA